MVKELTITIGPTSARIQLIINAFFTSLFVTIKIAAINSINEEINRRHAIVNTVPFK